jgi:putative toxin-antitoxin system antitoxin component (TIGR02293 family)
MKRMKSEMPTEASQLAALLGVKPQRRSKIISSLDLADEVVRGLPVEAVDRLCVLIAPGDVTLRHRLVPKATLARRQRTAERRLSPEESDRLARLARLWTFAADVWGSQSDAQRFFAEPHPLLGGRIPREVATETEIGARAVEDLLGRLKYGSAA